MTDDDSLAAYDLSAWHAPPPPAGLADAVVRRMTQPHRPVRRVWVVAACAVTAAAAVMIALLIVDRREPAVNQAAATDESRREIDRVLAELARLDAELTALQAKLPVFDEAATAPAKTVPAPAPKQPTAPRSMGADVAAVQAVMKRIKPALFACNDGSFAGTLTLDLHIDKTGKLTTLVFDRRVAFERCLETTLSAAKFDVRSGTTLILSFPIAFPKQAKVRAACDADALQERASEMYQRGQFASALTGFERSLACKWDATVVSKAMLAACSAKNAAKARMLWPKVSPGPAPMLVQRCLANGIDPR